MDTVDMDPGLDSLVLISQGMSDVFVQKLDPNGHLLWAKQIGGPANDSGLSIAVDEEEHVYLIGSFDDSIDVDPGAGTHVFHTNGERNTFVLQLDQDGNLGWAKHLRGLDEPRWENENLGQIVHIDQQGDLLLTIKLRGLGDLISDTDTLSLQSKGSWDLLLMKVQTDGQLIWHKQFGGADYASIIGRQLRSDSAGNIYLTGAFSDSVDVDPGQASTILISKGGRDIFTLKLDSTGQLLWATSQGSPEDDTGQALQLDHAGDVFVGGQTDFHYDHPSEPPFSTDKDLFLQKRDSQGNLLWENHIGGDHFDNLAALAVDSSGNLIVFANLRESVDVDPGPDSLILHTQGFSDMFILKLSPHGNLIWVRTLAGAGEDFSRQLILTHSQEMIVTGSFHETIDVDPGADSMILSSSGELDFFISKYKLEEANGLFSPLGQASPFSVYPNPSSGTFEIHPSSIHPLQILVYDPQGKLVKRLTPDNQRHDISDLARSMYVVLIQTKEGWLASKLLLNQ